MPTQSTFDKIRTRPRFKLATETTPEDYIQKLKDLLLAEKEGFTGNINREGATIFVRSSGDNYWKPNLSLRAENEDGRTTIRGIFGPSSAVWTFFMFLYLVFGIAWMVMITLWFVGRQIKSEDYGWALPASFAMLMLIFGVYLAARFGQKKAKPEMDKLREFAVRSVRNVDEV